MNDNNSKVQSVILGLPCPIRPVVPMSNLLLTQFSKDVRLDYIHDEAMQAQSREDAGT